MELLHKLVELGSMVAQVEELPDHQWQWVEQEEEVDGHQGGHKVLLVEAEEIIMHTRSASL